MSFELRRYKRTGRPGGRPRNSAILSLEQIEDAVRWAGSVSALARKIGISRSTLITYKNRHRGCGIDFVNKLRIAGFEFPESPAERLARDLVARSRAMATQMPLATKEKFLAPKPPKPPRKPRSRRSEKPFDFTKGLVHVTLSGALVRSKSEVIVANLLTHFGVRFLYEEPVCAPGDPNDWRVPDFIIAHGGRVLYWEHLGALRDGTYCRKWREKRAWYTAHGLESKLLTSEDGPHGAIDCEAIARTIRERVLRAEPVETTIVDEYVQ